MLRPLLQPFAQKTSVKQCLLRRYDLQRGSVYPSPSPRFKVRCSKFDVRRWIFASPPFPSFPPVKSVFIRPAAAGSVLVSPHVKSFCPHLFAFSRDLCVLCV